MGDGLDNRAITNIGVTPDVVIINAHDSYDAQMRTSTMSGDFTKNMTGGGFQTNRIQSIDNLGFTLGSHSTVNKKDIKYYYTAFTAYPGLVEVGSYVGNGQDNRTLTPLSFKPDILIIFGNNSGEPAFMISQMSADESFNFASSDLQVNRIQQLLNNGFQLGNDVEVNGSGFTYHYIALKSTFGVAFSGKYTGNGIDNTSITVGFEPDVLFVKGISKPAVVRYMTLTGDTTHYVGGNQPLPNLIQSFTADGFTVGTDGDINESARDYYYFGLRGSGAGLPVELLYFTAQKDGALVRLEWKTATEVNNDYFTVERSTDGLDFTAIGTLAGAGNSSIPNYYYQIDDSPLPQTAYYRLRQTDFDGSFTYSKTVAYELTDEMDVKILYNPLAGNRISIILPGSIQGNVSGIEMVDNLGRTILTQSASVSATELSVVVNEVPSGVYYLLIRTKGTIFSKRFMLF